VTFDADGRYPQLQRVPIDGLTPGLYELRITVGDDSKTAAFRIEP
jgi:hypothetical protein